MRLLILLLGIATICCTGCARYSRRDTSLYQTTGRQKAIVTVLPVIDRTAESELCWDLSQEFTDEIRKRVYDSPRIYLLRDEGDLAWTEQFTTPDIEALPTDMQKQLGATEFVVAAELIGQELTSYPAGDNFSLARSGGTCLSVSMRIRVIDVRHDAPLVVLQEILTQNLPVSQPYLNTDYTKIPWGTESFQRSPMGLAHGRLMREVVARVEGYIEAAR